MSDNGPEWIVGAGSQSCGPRECAGHDIVTMLQRASREASRLRSERVCLLQVTQPRRSLALRSVLGARRPSSCVAALGTHTKPGYPLRPQLDLLDRQLISTQSHQRRPRLIVTPDAVAILGRGDCLAAEDQPAATGFGAGNMMPWAWAA
jgi:hypothetical protein